MLKQDTLPLFDDCIPRGHDTVMYPVKAKSFSILRYVPVSPYPREDWKTYYAKLQERRRKR